MSFGISSFGSIGKEFYKVGKTYMWDVNTGNKRFMDETDVSEGWVSYTDRVSVTESDIGGFEVGDEISVELNTNEDDFYALKYFVNDVDLGVAFDNITHAEYHLAIELVNTNDKVQILL